jgi:hypothetical protein
MRFWGHVPNSLRNKNMERHIPYLLFKMVLLGAWEENFSIDFECYDLANGEE